MTATAYELYRRWSSEPLRTRPRISVVVPAYNEEIRILPTVAAIAVHLSRTQESWELVVADDGSTDRTVELLRGLGWPNLVISVTARNGGKGSAVRRGMAAARGEYVLFADADQSTPIEQLETLLREITDHGHDLAIGSRAAAGSSVTGKSALRRLLSRGLRTMVRVGFGLPVADTQCGFKLFTADAARRLFALQVVDGFSFDLEVLYLAHKLGLRTAEVPVEWVDAPGSTVDAAKVSAQFVRDLLAIRWRDACGRYRSGRTLRGQVAAVSGSTGAVS